MEEPTNPAPRDSGSKLFFHGLAIGDLGGVLWLIYMIYAAINMINTGKGLDTYRTLWLVSFNWYGFLAFIFLCAAATATGLWFRWREHMQWKSLEEKYRQRKSRT